MLYCTVPFCAVPWLCPLQPGSAEQPDPCSPAGEEQAKQSFLFLYFNYSYYFTFFFFLHLHLHLHLGLNQHPPPLETAGTQPAPRPRPAVLGQDEGISAFPTPLPPAVSADPLGTRLGIHTVRRLAGNARERRSRQSDALFALGTFAVCKRFR